MEISLRNAIESLGHIVKFSQKNILAPNCYIVAGLVSGTTNKVNNTIT